MSTTARLTGPRAARGLARVVRLVTQGTMMAVLLGALGACAGHSARTVQARTALDAGNPREALELYNEQLEVDSAKELPEDVSGANALLLLDRGMLLQALGDYKLSSRDLQIADKEIDLLDLNRGTLDDIGKYVFSDDTGPYRAPPYERLMINTVNMLNYLALRDLNGARVEARRLTVIQKYIQDTNDESRGLLGPGSYLAGFIFEKSGSAQEALLYYDEALQYGSATSLGPAIQRTAKKSSYRSPRLTKVLESQPAPTSDQPTAELLVVVSYGRVPAKHAERVPIGLALTYASGALSPADHQRANSLAAQGLVTWVNFPSLGKPRGSYDQARVKVDGTPLALDAPVRIDVEAKEAWDATQGTVVASAITRTISRIVAGETTRKAAGGGTVGLLLSLGTQATLTAVDTPDTRSWATLPARIAIGRLELAPGKHQVEIVVSGERRSLDLTLKAGEWAVANLTVLR